MSPTQAETKKDDQDEGLAPDIQSLETPVEVPTMNITMTAAAPFIADSLPTSSASGNYPPQSEDMETGRYDEMRPDFKHQTSSLIGKATSWVRDVLPNIVTDMLEGLDQSTHAEGYAQVDQKVTAWDHCFAWTLIKETIQALLLTTGRIGPSR